MEEITLRHIEPEKLDDYRQFRLHALAHDPDVFLPAVGEEKSRMAKREQGLEDNMNFAAFADLQMVGFVTLTLQGKLELRHVGLVANLYVKPDYRQVGVARKLLLHVIEEAKKIKLYSLQLKLITADHAAIKLYESLGFRCWATEKKALYREGKFVDLHYFKLVL